MPLTTKGRFAVTAMIDLALRSTAGPVALAAISQRQQISLSYLEQLFASCAATNWSKVRAARAAATRWAGPRLTSRWPTSSWPSTSRLTPRGGAGKENCMGEDAGRCMTHDLWASLNARMVEYLDSISLKKLVDEQLAKGVLSDVMPMKRAISNVPVVKPIKITAPNSVFALGNAFTK